MSKKLVALIKQNLVLSLRNSLIWVILLSMVIIILAVKFAVPKEITSNVDQYFWDDSQDKAIESALVQFGVDETRFMTSYENLEKLVFENKSAIGIVFNGSLANPQVELLQSTAINKEQLKIVQTTLSKMIGSLNGTWNSGVNIEFISPQTKSVPRNLTLVPVLLVFEVLILGFLLIAVFIFQEKGDKVIRAYRISPGGTHLYILSKLIAFLVIGLVYAFAIVTFTCGFNFNMINFTILTITGFILYTLIGLIVALFFEDISGWFSVGIVLLTINMAPGISHQMPSFAPAFMRYIPSYHVIFGYDDILFSEGKNLAPTLGLLALTTIVAYIVCYILVDKKLMREAI